MISHMSDCLCQNLSGRSIAISKYTPIAMISSHRRIMVMD